MVRGNLRYKGLILPFREDGYLDATTVASYFGKRPQDYLKTERTREYIQAVVDHLKSLGHGESHEIQLTYVTCGGHDQGGTWLHPRLIRDFARWLDANFSVWCNEYLLAPIKGRQSEVPPEPSIEWMRAKAKLINARTDQALAVCKITERLSPRNPQEVLGLLTVAVDNLLGTSNYRPPIRHLLSAAAVGEILGVSALRVDHLTNIHNLKTDTYGMFVLTKATHSEKQVSTFMYYEDVVDVLRTLLDVPRAA